MLDSSESLGVSLRSEFGSALNCGRVPAVAGVAADRFRREAGFTRIESGISSGFACCGRGRAEKRCQNGGSGVPLIALGRDLFIDYARRRGSEKRGGDLHRVAATGFEPGSNQADLLPLLELDRAIDALAAENPLLARAIEMRYFGGLTAEEAAEVSGRSVHSVRHDLRFAQAWLRRTLAGEQA